MASFSPPPLTGIRVIELGGLAPGPYAGMLLADYGASVLRIDRPNAPSRDLLTRHKTAVAIELKTSSGRESLLSLVRHADILIDPFRPGVLENLGIGPDVLQKHNPRIIIARMTGFRRTGKYHAMAGHDINYLSVAGVLNMLGRKGGTPYAPGNIVGDFAGGGMVLFAGILMALLHRTTTGKGQVVEANMVDGAAHLATFPRLVSKTFMWDQPRGENMLDGGSPWYDTYITKDGGYMAVGALEPQFFAALIKGLQLDSSWNKRRMDKDSWPALRKEMEAKFKSKSRKEWEQVFDGTDACCTPVLAHAELEAAGYDQRPLVTLAQSPGLAIAPTASGSGQAAKGQGPGVEHAGWEGHLLEAGDGTEQVLKSWTGWEKGKEYDISNGALVLRGSAKPRL